MSVSKNVLELNYSYLLICFHIKRFIDHKSVKIFESENDSCLAEEPLLAITKQLTAICT